VAQQHIPEPELFLLPTLITLDELQILLIILQVLEQTILLHALEVQLPQYTTAPIEVVQPLKQEEQSPIEMNHIQDHLLAPQHLHPLEVPLVHQEVPPLQATLVAAIEENNKDNRTSWRGYKPSPFIIN